MRLYIYLAAALAILAGFGGMYAKGRSDGRALCDSGNLTAQLKEAQDNILRWKTAAEKAEQKARDVEQFSGQVDGKVAALEAELDLERNKPQPEAQVVHVPVPAPTAECPAPAPPRPGRAAPYGATVDDLRRLRSIGPD